MTIPTVVETWTGVEVMALRRARRLCVREFAKHLGVSDRMVSKWEAGGASVRPRPFNQQTLDISLGRCTVEERWRFALLLQPPPTKPEEPGQQDTAALVRRCLDREDARRALAVRDMATVFRILNTCGVPQRQIAAMTGQSQSEISEIMAGRRVGAYDVLARIADGLGVPRGFMGLAYDRTTSMFAGESS